MDLGQLLKFAARHGNVSVMDSTGQSRILASGEKDYFELVEKADRFLWDGYWRSRWEMEVLVSQSERGLEPGCVECGRLERELIEARERDRMENRVDSRHELPALGAFKDHRMSHQ